MEEKEQLCVFQSFFFPPHELFREGKPREMTTMMKGAT